MNFRLLPHTRVHTLYKQKHNRRYWTKEEEKALLRDCLRNTKVISPKNRLLGFFVCFVLFGGRGWGGWAACFFGIRGLYLLLRDCASLGMLLIAPFLDLVPATTSTVINTEDTT